MSNSTIQTSLTTFFSITSLIIMKKNPSLLAKSSCNSNIYTWKSSLSTAVETTNCSINIVGVHSVMCKLLDDWLRQAKNNATHRASEEPGIEEEPLSEWANIARVIIPRGRTLRNWRDPHPQTKLWEDYRARLQHFDMKFSSDILGTKSVICSQSAGVIPSIVPLLNERSTPN